MACQPDDLEVNPFFRCLQTTFHAKYEEAQKNCWIICVPQSSSVKGLKITGQIIDYHIFKPSRYFKSQFVSTDKSESRTIEIDGRKIILHSGYNGYSVDILAEELSYNKDFKPFKLYVISKPLDLQSASKVQRINSYEKKCLEPKISYMDCCTFLRGFSCHLAALNDLDRKLHLFNQNYVVLENYLDDVSRKLQDIVYSTTKVLLNSHCPPVDEQDPLASQIRPCIESYVIGKVHHKIFSVIRQRHVKEDQELADCLQKLYYLDITPDQLGVKKSFCCGLPSAVVELASLNSLVTPSEKIHCLKTSLEHIPEDIFNAFKLSENPFNKCSEIPNLTSDDLIPLLVTVLVQARVQYLESNLFYIQNFTWQLTSGDKQYFSLVTFQAAKEFLKSHNFSHLQPSSNKAKKEMSLEELIEVTVELQKQKPNELNTSVVPVSDSMEEISKKKSGPIPGMERLTKMIEDSTRELRQQENVHFQATQFRRSVDHKRSSEENLGDFLSSFQKDGFGVTYGKQT